MNSNDYHNDRAGRSDEKGLNKAATVNAKLMQQPINKTFWTFYM